jgi:hypothetical protein
MAVCALLSSALPGGGAPRATGRPAAGIKVVPEVFWVSVSINGRRCGFGRGEYTRGEAAPYQYQNLILFQYGGFSHAQRDWWEFNGHLRPANFFEKVISWKGGQSVTNTVDGVFHYDKGKLKVEYNEFNTHENVEVPLPPNPLSRFTQNLLMAHQKLTPGRVFSFKVYDLKGRRFATERFKILGYDAAMRAWKIEQTSEEAPGAVGTIWFQTATRAHPNGWTLRTVTPGANRTTIEAVAVTRAQAVRGFEREAAALGI